MTTDSSACQSRRAWRFALGGTFLTALAFALGGVANAGDPIVPKTEKKGGVPPIKDPIVPQTEQETSIPRPETESSFWCRGPLTLEGGVAPAVTGTKAATAAGEGGAQLQPGECALEKRAPRNTDPMGVRFVSISRNDLQYMTGMMPVLTACAHDSNCVVRIRVGPKSHGWWPARNLGIFTKPYSG